MMSPCRLPRLPGLAAALALLLLLGGTGCRAYRWLRNIPDASVLMITVDSLRSDRVTQAVTPHLMALAEQGALLPRLVPSSSDAPPSQATLLTGLHPFQHGVRGGPGASLAPEVDTLAERLRAKGYATGAFVSSRELARVRGLDQGFVDWDHELLLDRTGRAVGPLPLVERPAPATVDRGIRWLAEHRAEKLFLWIHLADPSLPRRAPPELVERLAGSTYDAEVAWVDAEIGRLLASLDRIGRREGTLVVVAGAHGEGLGEHGQTGHGYLLDEPSLRSAAVVAFPGLLPGGKTFGGMIRGVDLTPTILDLLGLPWQPRGPGRLGGRSLAPELRGAAPADGPAAAYAETHRGAFRYGWAPLRCLIRGPWKAILSPEPELYDLASDPRETTNRIQHPPAEMSRIQADLALVQAEELRAPKAAPLLPSQVVPRTRVELLPWLEELEAHLEVGRTGPAEVLARRLVTEDPTNPLLLEALAAGLVARGEKAEAARLLERAVGMSGGRPEALASLGWLRLELGDLGGAEEAFRWALRIRPEARELRAAISSVRLRQGRPEEALAEAEAALERAPTEPAALHARAMALLALGRAEEAHRDLTLAARLLPGTPEVQHDLDRVRLALESARGRKP